MSPSSSSHRTGDPRGRAPSREQLAGLVTLYNGGALEQAVDRARELIQAFPDAAILHDLHGLASAGLGRIDAAVACHRRAVGLDPTRADARAHLGDALLARGDLQGARASFSRALGLDSGHLDACNGLANALFALGEVRSAVERFRQVVARVPGSADAHHNLAVALHASGELAGAAESYRSALRIDPTIAEAHNNLGLVLDGTGSPAAAVPCYEAALRIRPDFAEAHHNRGVALRRTGDLDGAFASFEQAARLEPGFVDTHNQMGNVLVDQGDVAGARRCYERALATDPAGTDAPWNLSGVARGVQEARHWLERCLRADRAHGDARRMLAGLEAWQGNPAALDRLGAARDGDHPWLRSFRWVLGLPERPALHFDRWSFFDAVIAGSDRSRPFYEFGVWRGASFRHLVRAFGRGYGFDTFQGLPEAWHENRAGAYSSGGQVPEIPGGEFVVGRFQDTLPDFFARDRPLASVIHLDADLYASTLCALEHVQGVVDERTILVFDELIMNERWEDDELRALDDFCARTGWSYRVLTVSFFTKQVAVSLVR